MLKIENVEVVGWEHAIRGMRNPKNSWEKSDSFIPCSQQIKCSDCSDNQRCDKYLSTYGDGKAFRQNQFLGPNDHSLMMTLRNAGTDHRKFMRMITVYLDITAPLYWWKEFDTYKVGTVANSCSTMHKIHAKEFTLEDFSCEHLIDDKSAEVLGLEYLEFLIGGLNKHRRQYIETKDKKYWWQMIQLLPTSYNQKRTVMLNYEVLANIYKSRKDHKLDDWHTFCDWIKTLPYSEIITGDYDDKKR